MDERKKEPNWTELLEKEYPDGYDGMVAFFRSQGRTDKEIYQLLESFG